MTDPLDLEKAFAGLMREAHPRVELDSVQYRESRRMFYAGAAALFFYTIAVTDLPEDEAVVRLSHIQEQLTVFFQKRMGRGQE